MKRVAVLSVVGFLLVACQDATQPDPNLISPLQLSTTGIVLGTETRITIVGNHQDPAISGDRFRAAYSTARSGSWQ